MTLRISEFFWEDLLEEQHNWTISQLVVIYSFLGPITEEEVISALVKANEKFATDPRSACYRDPDIHDEGSAPDSLPEGPCGNVQRNSGKARDKGSP